MEGQGNSSDRFTVASCLGTFGITITTSNALSPYKAARNDALAYVASADDIRGVRLESTLHHYRSHHPDSAVSDMQLALSFATLH